MAEAKRPRKWRGPITLFCESRRVRWIVLVGLLPALYVASYGPIMWWLWRKLGFPSWMETAAEYVYAPLLLTLNHSPQWVNDGFWVYTDWWGFDLAPYRNVTGFPQ